MEVGAYRLLHVIGEGGMGAVYVGEHALLGRKAAIKVLLPALSQQAEIVQRFFNEARAVTQIADPGIVQVFDFGFDERGNAYIVMELLDGEPMDQRLARIGRFQPVDAVCMARACCTSLAAAHAKGIVHRDLKPENIFIVGDPAVTGGERPKILDFGIAKLSSMEKGPKTLTGMMLGTPVYMSPEQTRGAGTVDHRSDIYSIGCVLMTMLTGRPPFEGEGIGDLIAAHMREAPPRLASRVAGLPDVLETIVARCLAKSPDERFQTMSELAAALAQAEQVLVRSMTSTIAIDPRAPLHPSPTTLGAAAGQAAVAPRGRPYWIAAAVGILVGGALAAVTFLRREDAHAASAPLPPPPPIVEPMHTPPDAAIDAPVDAPPPDAAPIDAPKPRKHGKPRTQPKPEGEPDVEPTSSTVDRGD